MLEFHGQSLFDFKSPSDDTKIIHKGRTQQDHTHNSSTSPPVTPPSSPQAEGELEDSEDEWNTEMQDLDIDQISPKVFTSSNSSTSLETSQKRTYTKWNKDYVWSAPEDKEDLDYIPDIHENQSSYSESDISEGYTSEDFDKADPLRAIFLKEENLNMLRNATEEFFLPSWIGRVPKTVGSKTGGNHLNTTTLKNMTLTPDLPSSNVCSLKESVIFHPSPTVNEARIGTVWKAIYMHQI
ncbi:uncharacterized protein MELLADRAFT_101663 [Melampsora larici-populina 98AG31]|uniref:Uncharacterized protein n=1 Tax=Melampsora larici-populina (strain 98AG31 / pathotype 3-4-7) TaxID=747676 RepID=F4R6K3_MELLP|nr:uncharacterized protein MELLADRAFT_101663 [Melampsora larici-populina 98AG31]EGG12450.1 hypothetical protein MELLADRAFT_101663 [Melampsora larici-populina 98AG31]